MTKTQESNVRCQVSNVSVKGFTLVELIVAFGILAAVASVTVSILNPSELLARTRDATRVSDLQTISRALAFYTVQGGGTFGDGNIVYTSLPDASSTCASHTNLPALPAGWSYHCSPSSDFRKVDSTGWVPVPFDSIQVGSPLAKLPVDPINNDFTGNYYTYTKGSWLVTAKFESQKYSSQATSDGGQNDFRYEEGSDKTAMGEKSNSTSAVVAYGSGTTGVSSSIVSNPTFSPVAGTYAGTQSVTISSSTSGASIRYTTDGSTPTSSVGTVYSSAVSISATSTLKAIAYKSGMTDSAVTSAAYTITATPPLPPPASVPSVATPTSASITSTSATLGANVTSDGGAAITARGTCWGTTAAPTTNCLAEGGTTTGVFTHSRTGLTASTTYFYRGYAANSAGTGYSADATFTTGAAPTTTLGGGINPSNATIAPGTVYAELDAFTLATSSGTDSVTALTVMLGPAGAFNNIREVRVTNSSGSTIYLNSIVNPANNTISLSGGTAIPVSTTATTFKVGIFSKDHSAMPAVPGASYATTGTVTAFTSTNSQAGADTSSATITIDNASPGIVTGASVATNGNGGIVASWTDPADSDLSQILIVRKGGSAVAETPAEGVSYSVGVGTGTLAGTTVVFAGSGTTFTDTPTADGTVYYYKIFAKDSRGNYSSGGTVPTGSGIKPQLNTGYVNGTTLSFSGGTTSSGFTPPSDPSASSWGNDQSPPVNINQIARLTTPAVGGGDSYVVLNSFGFTIPSGSSIDKICVWLNNASVTTSISGNQNFRSALTWDNSTFTSENTNADVTNTTFTGIEQYWIAAPSSSTTDDAACASASNSATPWGHSWTATQINSSTNFGLRIKGASDNTTNSTVFRFDIAAVKIYYTP